MKASELRIGNFISSCFPISVVIGIDDEGVIDTAYYEHGKGVDYTSECHSNEGSINPIPLTEEWLVKLGMISYVGWDDLIFWCAKGGVGLNDRFELLETAQGYESPSGKIIDSVHILQNAYYFHTLTGEELTINED